MPVLSLDLSIGGVIVGVSHILTSGLLPCSDPVLLLIAVDFGIAVGLPNTFSITRLRESSVIVTLAVTLVITGVAVAFSQLRSPGDAPEILRQIVRGDVPLQNEVGCRSPDGRPERRASRETGILLPAH